MGIAPTRAINALYFHASVGFPDRIVVGINFAAGGRPALTAEGHRRRKSRTHWAVNASWTRVTTGERLGGADPALVFGPCVNTRACVNN